MALRNQEIATRIRELRGERPQTDVAEAVGASERAYQNWEAGTSKPSYRFLQALAEYHGVGENYILNGVDASLETPNPYKLSDLIDAVRAEFRDVVDLHNDKLDAQAIQLAELAAVQQAILAHLEQLAADVDELKTVVRLRAQRGAEA